MEHIKSKALVNRLDAFLNFPSYDPHGDPIPNENGSFPKSTAVPLNLLKVKTKGKVVAVERDEPSFLNYLDKIQVSIGTHVEIVDVNDFDHSIDVKIDGTLTHISLEVAQNILISIL